MSIGWQQQYVLSTSRIHPLFVRSVAGRKLLFDVDEEVAEVAMRMMRKLRRKRAVSAEAMTASAEAEAAKAKMEALNYLASSAIRRCFGRRSWTVREAVDLSGTRERGR